MKQVRIELNIDPEMFAATQQFMAEKGLEIGTELSDSVAKLYKSTSLPTSESILEGGSPLPRRHARKSGPRAS